MLPNPDMSFTPLTAGTASDMNDLVENIESLADGSGFDPGAIGPSERSGGFAMGTISGSSVLNTTGNKAITGVGFTPKLVRFAVIFSAANTTQSNAFGAMTASAQYYQASSANPSAGNAARNSSTSACIGWVPNSSTTPSLLCTFVSMDADGFTINVGTASSTFDVVYEAYA